MTGNHMKNMLMADRGKKVVPVKEGFTPIYFCDFIRSANSYIDEMTGISRSIFTYKGFSGFITPWHDSGFSSRMFKDSKKTMNELILELEKMDVSVRTYCIITCSISNYDQFERPALLYGYRPHWSWMRKLRTYAGSREVVDEVAEFIMRFIELEVSAFEKSSICEKDVVYFDKNQASGKVMSSYHKVVDRLRFLKEARIPWRSWLEEKFNACNGFLGKKLTIFNVVNINKLDPDLNDMKRKSSDPWNSIKEFLNLSAECEFPDGYIPKGWMPSSDDVGGTAKITKVAGNGFYYHSDGSMRRGRRHYMNNSYFIIKCEPSNFEIFKPEWDRKHLISASPTWEEYKNWSAVPGMWGEDGNGLAEGIISKVKWR